MLTRDALERARVTFPDPLIDVEHRGEGDCEIDGAAVVDTIAAMLRCALVVLGEGESLWMRSSGRDVSELAVDLRWRGAEPDCGEAMRAAALAGGRIVREDRSGEYHLGFRTSRSP